MAPKNFYRATLSADTKDSHYSVDIPAKITNKDIGDVVQTLMKRVAHTGTATAVAPVTNK